MILEQAVSSSGERIVVERQRYMGLGEIIQLKVGRGRNVQSFYPPISGEYYGAVNDVSGSPSSLLVLGVSGGTAGCMAKQGTYDYVAGVEYDSEMVRLGKKWFRTDVVFDEIVLGDVFDVSGVLSKLKRQKYDVIFFDAYRDVDVSARIYDTSFLAYLFGMLNDGGTLLVNCTSRKISDSLVITADLLVERLGRAVFTSSRRYRGNFVLSLRLSL